MTTDKYDVLHNIISHNIFWNESLQEPEQISWTTLNLPAVCAAI